MDEELAVFEFSGGSVHLREELRGTQPQAVALDSSRNDRVYCGTFGRGLWVSDDGGDGWKKNENSASIASAAITSLAVTPKDVRSGGKKREFSDLYVGTEPSRLYRSDDGGETWDHLSGLESLPSSKSWSFPPRPYTHHVRTIVCDPLKAGLVYAAIEAGALVRSYDGGVQWKDRVSGGPYDTHNLAANRSAPGRLYSSAGDGYFESGDYGETWRKKTGGLDYTYMYGVAVHSSDPDTVLVSCSPGPWSAYNPENAESHIYRSAKEGRWTEVLEGLPNPEGTTASFIIPNEKSVGEFYACSNRGIYVSEDAGLSWKRLDVPWKRSFKSQHVRHAAMSLV
jgi:BNR/Asp-box repeat protein